MAKKRSLPSPPPPPPAPVESSEEEEFSSSEEAEEEQQKTSILKNPNPSKDEEETEDAAEPEDEEEEEPEDEDEEAEEAEAEEENEEEEEEEAAAAVAAGKLPAPASESESGSDSDSDSDEAPKAIKPISSKPMPPGPTTNPSPAAFQRVWSLDDEIALLRGLLSYKENTGTVPHGISSRSGRFADFPELVRPSLTMDATDVQLSEKIRRLKAKHKKAAARGSPHFSSPHDKLTFELSEKIWKNGGENAAAANNEGPTVGGPYRFLEEAVAARKDFGAAFALETLEKVDPAKARMLDEKFKKQKMAAMKLHMQRMELQKETFKIIMEGVDRSG